MSEPAFTCTDIDALRSKLAETRAAMAELAKYIRDRPAYDTRDAREFDPALMAIERLRWREQTLQFKIERLGYGDDAR